MWRTARDLLLLTGGPEFWLFTLYDKDEMSDLTPKQRALFKERVKAELKAEKVMTKKRYLFDELSEGFDAWKLKVWESERCERMW